MNLILLFPEDFIAGTQKVRLTGRRQQHVLKVHRAKVDDELCVGLVNGKVGQGKILDLNDEELVLEVHGTTDAPSPREVTLLLALPRPAMLRRILFAVTTMGVKKIYLMNSFRVEKTFWDSHALREGDLREQMILGLEQSKDTFMPEIFLRPRFKPFVEDELPQLIEGTLPLLADPLASHLCPSGVQRPVTLVVGPEGGFIPFEIEKLMGLGFQPVHLSERIFRVETVVPALLGRLI